MPDGNSITRFRRKETCLKSRGFRRHSNSRELIRKANKKQLYLMGVSVVLPRPTIQWMSSKTTPKTLKTLQTNRWVQQRLLLFNPSCSWFKISRAWKRSQWVRSKRKIWWNCRVSWWKHARIIACAASNTSSRTVICASSNALTWASYTRAWAWQN